MQAASKVRVVARAAAGKKTRDIVILDLRRLGTFTDYFLLATSDSELQARAVADAIKEELRKAGAVVWHREGYEDAKWIVVDCGDVVAHLFLPEVREFYDLERLWIDARRVECDERGNPRRRARAGKKKKKAKAAGRVRKQKKGKVAGADRV